jgi:hypothetical protein
MHFFGRTKSGATAHGATMELLQFSRHSTTEHDRAPDYVNEHGTRFWMFHFSN